MRDDVDQMLGLCFWEWPILHAVIYCQMGELGSCVKVRVAMGLCSVLFRSVPFSSRWHLCSWKSPDVLHPIFQMLPQCHLWNGSNVRLIDDGPLSSFQGRCLLFPHLSHPGDRWCDALGFIPTGSASSSSTLQSFPEASHLWELLCLPVNLLSPGVALIAKFCVNIVFFLGAVHILAASLRHSTQNDWTPVEVLEQVLAHRWLPHHSALDLLANSVPSKTVQLHSWQS